MKAYIVFAGGGVKGAALAGAYDAAVNHGVEPIAFSGCSAGAIVACLAASGYTPEELRQEIVENDFSRFFDGRRSPLYMLEGDLISKCQELTKLKPSRSTFLRFLVCEGRRISRLWSHLAKHHGFDTGRTMTEELFRLVNAKVRCESGATDWRLSDFRQRQNTKPITILVSDIVNGRAELIRSDGQGESSDMLIESVRASASFPVAFQPVRMGNRLFVDGGLCSNLPTFAFEEVRKAKRIPVFAFNLVPSSSPVSATQVDTFCGQLQLMINTLLSGSDRIILNLVRNVHSIDIPVDPNISLFRVNLDRAAREELYQQGVRAFNDYWKAHLEERDAEVRKEIEKITVQDSQRAREQRTILKIRRDLGIPVRQIEILLLAIKDWVEKNTHAENVRVHVMFPTLDEKRIVVYQVGMDDHDDCTLELDYGSGCSGRALKEGNMVYADLRIAPQQEVWAMTREQHGRVPDHRRSMISVPLDLDVNDKGQTDYGATLSIDSSTPFDETGWFRPREDHNSQSNELVVYAQVHDTIKAWSAALWRIFA